MSSSELTNTSVYRQGASKKLIVFLHGYGPFAKRHLRAIANVITGQPVPVRTVWDRIRVVFGFVFWLLATILVSAFLLGIPYLTWSRLHAPHQAVLGVLALLVLVLLTGLIALAGLVVIVVLFCFWARSRPHDEPPPNDDESWETPKRRAQVDSMGEVIRWIAEDEPDADLLVPFYDASLFSSADVFRLASRLEDLLDRTCADRERSDGGYEQVVLIGHSVGALLMRKAYAYALGATEDHPVFGRRTQPKSWVSKVERLILLAPMNRGWDIRPRPRHMSLWKLAFYWLILTVSACTGTARLLRELRRGTVFVSNLRLQWIRLCREHGDAVAPMIMLLGDTDDMVSQEDHQDVLASDNFIHIPVAASGHGSIVKFQEPGAGEIRAAAFRKALTQSLPKLKEDFENSTQAVRRQPIKVADAHTQNLSGPGAVVFIMHGIRDFNDWTKELGQAIRDRHPNVKVVTSGYGYFPILRFLLLGARHRRVRLFMDWYTEAVAATPLVESDISFVGHSNATYILANVLRRYATVRLNCVALLGSIVPRDFPWDSYVRSGRVGTIRTDRAADDAVVAVFGRFFEAVKENFGISMGSFGEIGSSGFYGFNDGSTHEYEYRYFSGGHSAALNTRNLQSLAAFASTGVSRVDPTCLVGQQSGLVVWLSKFSLFVALGLVLALAAFGYGLTEALLALGGFPRLASWAAYVAALLALLVFF